MEGYWLFKRDRLGRKGSGVALCVKKDYECVEINEGDDRVESIWIRIKAKGQQDWYYRGSLLLATQTR